MVLTDPDGAVGMGCNSCADAIMERASTTRALSNLVTSLIGFSLLLIGALVKISFWTNALACLF
jgi:hypothetical protein